MAAFKGETPVPAAPTPAKVVHAEGTLHWLYDRYRESAVWADLALNTRKAHEEVLGPIMKEHGAKEFSMLNRAKIEVGLANRKDTPVQQRKFHNAITKLCGWAADPAVGHMAVNPATNLTKIRRKDNKEGHPTWTEAEIEQYQNFYPLGTRERVWLHVLLYTGTRISDAVRLGDHMIDGEGLLAFQTVKTDTWVWMPVLDELRTTLDAGPTCPGAWITSEHGRPYKVRSFGNAFADAARAAGIDKTAHGVRKAAACRAAEHGATGDQLNAVFGWTDAKMASRYTGAARRKVMARSAITTLKRAA